MTMPGRSLQDPPGIHEIDSPPSLHTTSVSSFALVNRSFTFNIKWSGNALLLGSTCFISCTSFTPSHSDTPFHMESKGSVGANRPLPTLSGLFSVRSEGNSPITRPPSTSPPNMKLWPDHPWSVPCPLLGVRDLHGRMKWVGLDLTLINDKTRTYMIDQMRTFQSQM